MEIHTFITFILLGVVHTMISPPHNYSIELEETLRTELFTNYTVQLRPSQQVKVGVRFSLLTVNDLNIKDQTLSLSGYLTLVSLYTNNYKAILEVNIRSSTLNTFCPTLNCPLKDWLDTRLSWQDTNKTSLDYTNIIFLFSSEEYIWRPAIIIENAVDKISVISDKYVPMRIASDGRVIWNPAGVYTVSCESDTTYYPMDTQECYLKVSAWVYTQAEIELHFKIKSVDKNFYTKNGEWNLLSAESFKSEAQTRDDHSFSSVSFLIKLQRRCLFHVVNTLFPVTLMAVLIAFVFKLPVDSGEKVGFSLTVLLSYAVYLTLISDRIPSTSVTVCFLSLYLAFILFLAAIAVCLTTFVINLHMRRDDDIMADWLKKFTTKYLIKFACLKNSYCRKDGSDIYVQKTNDVSGTDKTNSHDTRDRSEECRNITWKKLAEIMDKVFFNVYIILIIISTSTLFFIIIVGYTTADNL